MTYRLLLKKIIILSFLSFHILFSQNKNSSDNFFPYHQDYNLFNMGLAFNADLPNRITGPGFGGSMDFGFNLANFFKDDLLIAVYGGLSVMSTSSYQDAFLDKLKENITDDPDQLITNSTNGFDYENAFDELNHVTNNNVKAKFTLYYGLMIKLPFKYFPLIKLYKSLKSTSGSKAKRPVGFIVYNPSTSNPFRSLAGTIELDGHGFELDIYTYSINETGILGDLKIGQLSLYFEWFGLEQIKLGEEDPDGLIPVRKVELKKLLKSDSKFFDDYKTEFRIGIKIGINLL